MKPLIWAGASVDRAAVRLMERVMGGRRRLPARDPQRALEAAIAHYRRPDVRATFFAAPSGVVIEERVRPEREGVFEIADLAWRSGWTCTHEDYRWRYAAYRENAVAHARHFRARGTPRPVILCIHGWGGGNFRLERLAFVVPYLLRIGLDVALVQLPFHGARAPRGLGSGAKFPGPNVVRTNEAFGHAIRDLRALVAWLHGRGAPAVGAIGMSLGGYTTALLASAEPRLAFAVPMIPVASFADVMWSHGEGGAARSRAEAAGVTRDALRAAFEIHCPLERTPLVPFDRRLIIAGIGDRITPPEQARRLAAHWGEPRQHWFPGGHLAQFKRGEAFRALRAFLAGAEIIPARARSAA